MPEVVRKVAVSALSLDLNNFRFAVEQPDESMAFNYLFENEEVTAVAYSLLREGYTTNEVPLVVEEGGRYVVLEANRRVSALRALRDPSLVPSHRHQLETLLRRHQADADELPDEIYVTVYPDRQTAAPVLARLHIGEDKKRWGLDEQAKFVLAQLAGGADVKTLKATLTGIKDVVRLARMGRVREALQRTTFTDPAIREYALGQDLKMSAFEYAYRDRQIRPLLGFEFDDEGNVTSRPESPQQIAVLERVLRGFQTGELSTRRVLNAKKGEPGRAYDELVDELRSLSGVPGPAPSPAAVGAPRGDGSTGPALSGSPKAPLAAGASNDAAPGAPAPREDTPSVQSTVGPNNPDTKGKLVVAVDYSSAPAGLQKRFIELRRIDIVGHPAAAAMLLRSVVESSIKYHYTSRGNHQVSGTIGQVVPTLANDYLRLRSLARSIQLLQNALSPRDRPGSGSWFNGASHDPTMVVKSQDVRDAWQELEPLVRFLLQPPSPQTP
ncbi:MAG: hypothetical protein KQH57_18550 [Actinomycetales bacterium]|nr:hypothetical protein [Actinomycetales bacterium]